MIMYSKQVFGYVQPSIKERMRRICKLNREYKESGLIERGLEKILPEIERELGISPPTREPRGRKTAA